MDLILIEKFLISIALGAFLGTEREISKSRSGEKMAGVRTFALITLLGTILAHLSRDYPYVLLVGASGFMFLIIAGYWKIGILDVGITTEVEAIMALFIGVLCYEERGVAVILTILVGFILAIKKSAHRLIQKISDEELMDTLKFAIIALVILPVLPREPIDPFQVLNPYNLWLLVVFISGIGFVGYFLIRIFGTQAGTGLTGIMGGLVSSTAVTVTMSHRSRQISSILFPALFAATMANSMMYLRIVVEVFVVNQELITEVWIPMVAMMMTGLVATSYFWMKQTPQKVDVKVQDPFTLLPALKFGGFFAVVLLVSKGASLYLGEIGIYVASLFSGLADVDAVTLSMATLAGTEVSRHVAVDAIILAAISNTITKTAIAVFFGSQEFKKYMVMTSAAIMIMGMLTILFL
ncbi:MAG: MgtC/SapB family protein [Theionarchaea archaeon]|nr:MgtC/SapB family protein [Theionarchaea archaeon]